MLARTVARQHRSRYSSSIPPTSGLLSLGIIPSFAAIAAMVSFGTELNKKKEKKGYKSLINERTTALATSAATPRPGTAQSSKNKNDDQFAARVSNRHVHTPKVPYPRWDYNWDGRMTRETTEEAQAQCFDGEPVYGTTRHILLIRHGQYNEESKIDADRKLTPLGRLQAEKTGRRLEALRRGILQSQDKENKEAKSPAQMLRIYSSNMTRAKETAQIIAKQLQGNIPLVEPDERLNEAIPAPIIPVRADIGCSDRDLDRNQARLEEVFHSYFYRAPSEQGKNDSGEEGEDDDKHEFEIMVCHGNVIRFLSCRALQIPPEAWLRFSVYNCSITYLMIKPSGYVSCRMFGDVGHLDYNESTFSMNQGFAWS